MKFIHMRILRPISIVLFIQISKTPILFQEFIIQIFQPVLLAIVVSFSLGIIAFLFNYFILKQFTLEIIIIPLIAGIISNAIEVPLTLFATFYLFKKGHDPNNIMGPFVTSTGDVISIISLLIALVII